MSERGGHERRVDRRAPNGVVVRQHERAVELHREHVDVVRAPRRRLARVCGVPERVAGRGDGARRVEPAGGIRVAAVSVRACERVGSAQAVGGGGVGVLTRRTRSSRRRARSSSRRAGCRP